MSENALAAAIQLQSDAFRERTLAFSTQLVRSATKCTLRGRLSFAVLDSVMAATMACPELSGQAFRQAFESLKTDEDFVDKATRNTSDDATLEGRFASLSFPFD